MSEDASKSFSKLSLNPAAAEWKPNLNAKSFVPTFGAGKKKKKYKKQESRLTFYGLAPAPAPKVVKLPESTPAPGK